MVDWHCHILAGVDDGPAEIEQSLSMAAVLAKKGFTTIYCTPHYMRGCYETGNDEVLRKVGELQQLIEDKGIPVTLLPGREYCLDEYLLVALENPLPLGDSRQILVEIPSRLSSNLVQELFYDVVRSGFIPVIAHPERCPLLVPPERQRENRGMWRSISRFLSTGHQYKAPPDARDSTGNPLLDYLRELGCSFQGNLGSFTGFYGRQIKTAAETLQGMGVYDRYGSDLHASEHAEIILADFPA